MSKISVLLLSLALVALSSATVRDIKPFTRRIPADRLRDFPGMCFASTQCKVYKPEESWTLAPYCGKATCRIFEQEVEGKKKAFLIEEVTDCGPVIDTERTEGCKLVEEEEDEEAEEKNFPDCCPRFDCEEGIDIYYKGQEKPVKDGEEPEQEEEEEEESEE